MLTAAGPQGQQITKVLASTVILAEPGGQHRTFDPITRPSAGGGWITAHGNYDLPTMAALVLNPEVIVGIRHRHQTRLVCFDIDAHRPKVSPYWHPDGPDHSPALQRLLAVAEAVGCSHAIYRTPSGGWHCWILLPEAVHHSVAATVGQAMAARAALQVAPGRLEVFPSLTRWSDTSDARHRPRSNGFRLPGQQGGATWIGGLVGWCSEPSTAWEEAAAAVELADGAATAEWPVLLLEAADHRRQSRRRPALRGPGGGHRLHRAHAVAWTGPSQSERNLGLLTNALYQPEETPEQLGERVAAAARVCPGFSRYASRDTVSRLDAWCRDWARCCHKSPPRATAGHRARSNDPGRNNRFHRQTVAKVIDGAVAIAKDHGEAALRFSERKLADLLTLTRKTFRKVKTLFLVRLAAAIARPAVVGIHPLPKGGTTARQGQPLACLPENEHLDPIPPVASRPCRPPPPPPSAMPIAPASILTSRREHERNELARWLGLSAA